MPANKENELKEYYGSTYGSQVINEETPVKKMVPEIRESPMKSVGEFPSIEVF